MLMMPMTPKVMASPIAASSRTEPSDRPYQTFWPALQSAWVCSMRAIAASMSGLSDASALASVAFRTARLERPLPSASIVIARRFSSSPRSETSSETARASSRTLRTVASFSVAMAVSIASSASAFGVCSIDCAAFSRAPASSLKRVRPPSALRTARRTALLTLTFCIAAFGASPASMPVAGSTSSRSAPCALTRNTLPSDLRW
ncbi:hypothetical protein D9M72_407050 [compost metagenome]